MTYYEVTRSSQKKLECISIPDAKSQTTDPVRNSATVSSYYCTCVHLFQPGDVRPPGHARVVFRVVRIGDGIHTAVSHGDPELERELGKVCSLGIELGGESLAALLVVL